MYNVHAVYSRKYYYIYVVFLFIFFRLSTLYIIYLFIHYDIFFASVHLSLIGVCVQCTVYTELFSCRDKLYTHINIPYR